MGTVLPYSFRSDGAERVKRDLLDVGRAGERGFNQVRLSAARLSPALKTVDSSLVTTQRGFQNMAASAAILTGPLGGVASRLAGFGALLGRVGPLGLVAAVGLGAVTLGATKAVTFVGELERQTGRLEAVIKATGGAAGITGREIDDFARGLGRATLTSAGAVREAAASLLTFKSVGEDTFFRTLTLAQDMSEVFGQDLRGSTVQLAKALEDPIRGLTALRRVGVSFTADQQATIKSLVETNRLLEAQTLILDVLEGQLGGAGEQAAQGLAGAFDTLGENTRAFFEILGENTGLAEISTEVLNKLAGAVGNLNENFGRVGGRETSVLRRQAESIREEIARLEAIRAAVDTSAILPRQEEVARLSFPGDRSAAVRSERARVRLASLDDQLGPLRDLLRDLDSELSDRDFAAAEADVGASDQRIAAEEERAANRAKSLADFIAGQERELDLARQSAAVRKETEIREKARAALAKQVADATEAELVAAADRAVVAAQALAATDAAAKTAEQESEAREKISTQLDETLSKERDQERILAARLAGKEDEVAIEIEIERLVAMGIDADDRRLATLRDTLADNRALTAEIKAQEDARREAEQAAREQVRRREQDFRQLSAVFLDIFSERGFDFWELFRTTGLRVLAELSAAAFLSSGLGGFVAGATGGRLGSAFAGGGGVSAAAAALSPAQRTATLGNVAAGAQRAVAGAPAGFFASPAAQSAAVGSAVSRAVDAFGEDDGIFERIGKSFSGTFKNEFKDFAGLLGDGLEKVGLNLGEIFGDTASKLPELLGQAGGGAAAGFATTSVLKGLGLDVSSTGGAIGGAIGKFVPIPGGSIIGSVIGGLLGGLFSKTPFGSATATTNEFGRFGVDSAGRGSGREDQAVSLAFGTIGVIEQIAGAVGGTIAAGINLGSIGTRGKKFVFDPSGSGATKGKGVDKFGSEEEALAAQLATALSRGIIDGVGATAAQLLRTATAATIERVVEDAAALESVPRRLKGLVDPLGAALDELNREFTALKKTFLDVGASTGELADLEKLFALERERILADQQDAQVRILKDFLGQLQIGDASPLSLRDQRALVVPEFEALAASIAAGESVDQEAFTKAAADLLNIERQLSGSTAGFFALFDEIRELTEMAIANATPGGSGVESVANPFPDLAGVESATTSTARDTAAVRDLMERNNALLEQIARGGGGGGGFQAFSFNGAAFAQ